MSVIKKLTVLNLFCALFFLYACSGDEVSKEDQVRQVIESAKLAAENRSPKDVAVLIDGLYSDDKAHDKKKLISIVSAYFYMHKNIHLFTKIDEIVFPEDDKAIATVYVAMAGSVISDTSVLTSLRAKIYKFELQLIKKEEWLLKQAKWERSSFKDMMNIKPTEKGYK
ncbi:MAG: hypothetical protein OEY06_09765 [Gammaproteobacteria bacterium]|nr:hypothetical protein [Gammaproteobacteria bacterium]